MTWSTLLAGYLLLGAFCLVFLFGQHYRQRRKSDRWRDEFKAAVLGRRPDWRRAALEKLVVPAITGILVVFVWPVAVFLAIRHSRRPNVESSNEVEPAFSVLGEHLAESLDLHEVERRELVKDPFDAVPAEPFGHLNARWLAFRTGLTAEDRVWSFKADWRDEWGRPEQYSGYVSVRYGVPGNFLVVEHFRIERADPR